jgi:Kef-type K+ transport system membrane component KefB
MQQMIDPAVLAADLAWPLTLLIAWAMGEVGQRWLRIPRISIYAIVGFLLASPQAGFLPPTPSESIRLLANIAFGLIIFEAGYRINLRWLRANPWIAVTSIAESVLSFGAVYALVRWRGMAEDPALMIAALAMATSPATVLRVITELRTSGQVTERIMHLSALNTALAVLVLKVLVGLTPAGSVGDVPEATYDTVLVLLAAVLSGLLMGAFVPAMLKAVRRTTLDGTIAYAIAVIVLAALNHGLGLSPMLATLTFGLVSRHRRVFLTATQRGFGTLGSVLTVILFVFAAVSLEWRQVGAGLGLGVAIILVRQTVKIAAVGSFSFLSGISWRKGLFTGLAMAPMSAIALLVLEQSREIDLGLLEQLAPLAAASLLMEMLGPIIVGRVLHIAQETPDTQEG